MPPSIVISSMSSADGRVASAKQLAEHPTNKTTVAAGRTSLEGEVGMYMSYLLSVGVVLR
jgi:hypothetical protein